MSFARASYVTVSVCTLVHKLSRRAVSSRQSQASSHNLEKHISSFIFLEKNLLCFVGATLEEKCRLQQSTCGLLILNIGPHPTLWSCSTDSVHRYPLPCFFFSAFQLSDTSSRTARNLCTFAVQGRIVKNIFHPVILADLPYLNAAETHPRLGHPVPKLITITPRCLAE